MSQADGVPGPHHERAREDVLDDAVAQLGARARRRNADRADRVVALLARGATALDATARAEAASLCHTVAGSAGTFGDEALTGAARSLEAALRAGRDDDLPAALEHFRAAARCASSR
ncbi:Hpt domain-containing protein [Isoptericola croceus]|uniref:Hpt domain-containing protein n=1 Tax=Isoptericola croceus TaxID=3031406 RepID=UPI0023F96EA9|nr:Hpt domain-containing protein [Isoptericola croceus]